MIARRLEEQARRISTLESNEAGMIGLIEQLTKAVSQMAELQLKAAEAKLAETRTLLDQLNYSPLPEEKKERYGVSYYG